MTDRVDPGGAAGTSAARRSRGRPDGL